MGRAFEFRKERKMKRWGQMAKTFTKIGKEIAFAVKEGGPDPESNSRLRVVMQNAKSANMPKDNVERAIKKASSKDQEAINEVVYEGYGPHGIAVVVECMTDNTTRTVANVRLCFNKYGGSMGTTGSNDFLFERKCVFKIPFTEGMDLEELEFELIDVGVEELDADEGEVILFGDFTAFGSIQKHLESAGYEILSAGTERIPHDTKKLTEEQEAEFEILLGKIEEDEDVLQVFHNMG